MNEVYSIERYDIVHQESTDNLKKKKHSTISNIIVYRLHIDIETLSVNIQLKKDFSCTAGSQIITVYFTYLE